jgi:hypothetical protein
MSSKTTENQSRSRGRPGNTAPAADWYDSDLYKLLLANFPEYVVANRLHIPTLAKDVGFSSQTLYRGLSNQALSSDVITNLIALSERYCAREDVKREPLTLAGLVSYLPKKQARPLPTTS